MGASWTKFYDNYNKPKKDLYHMVKWQNEMMEVESAKLRDQYSTDIERIKHINNDLLGWNQLNFILWLIYYVIFFVISQPLNLFAMGGFNSVFKCCG